jgi:pimeloyl-ACP methyl ester carboxylesterase
MPFVDSEGVKLYYEDVGSGTPVVFVHEFSGDHRSWEPQVRYFCRRYRCITFDARGYPPSDVPEQEEAYSQDTAVDDLIAVLDHLGIEAAHLVGLSMGAFTVLHAALRSPARARSVVAAACGYGVTPDAEAEAAFRDDMDALAYRFEADGAAAAQAHAAQPSRMPFKVKDPRGWEEFAREFAKHSYAGAALTLRGVQRDRPNLIALEDELRRVRVPTLIVNGDEDDGCLEPGIWLKRVIPSAALVVLPKTGHTINLEEPALFNASLQDFLSTVDRGRWPTGERGRSDPPS